MIRSLRPFLAVISWLVLSILAMTQAFWKAFGTEKKNMDYNYRPQAWEIICLVASVCLGLWELRCAPLTCIVHHQAVLCTMVHKVDLYPSDVGVTPNIFIFWWFTRNVKKNGHFLSIFDNKHAKSSCASPNRYKATLCTTKLYVGTELHCESWFACSLSNTKYYMSGATPTSHGHWSPGGAQCMSVVRNTGRWCTT